MRGEPHRVCRDDALTSPKERDSHRLIARPVCPQSRADRFALLRPCSSIGLRIAPEFYSGSLSSQTTSCRAVNCV